VIYKIVNEDPVPPRQLDPSIHQGISAVIMKSLCKEPDERYQTCRELLDDLRNYRANAGLAGNPQSTMAMGGAASPATTAAVGTGAMASSALNDNYVAATAGSLSSRTNSPGQTPIIRRTGSIPPVAEPPKKNSALTSVLIAILLLAVIAWGANKLLPVFLAAREFHEAGQMQSNSVAQNNSVAGTPAKPQPSIVVAPASSRVSDAASAAAKLPAKGAEIPAASPAAVPELVPAEVKTEVKTEVKAEVRNTAELPAPRPAVSTPEPAKPTLNAKASEYKSRIDAVIAERGLAGRVRVQGVGNTLTISGKLRPVEHGALLKFLRDTPSDLRVIDHIEYDDAPVATAAGDEGTHPVPSPDRGAIHVVTDVLSATATLYGPAGRQLRQCQTPCSFNGLQANGYSLEVKKDGYRPVQTALQVKTGEVIDQKLKLESLALGLKVISDPPGADVFINGDKQSGQTPMELPLAPGQYNLVLRLEGYSAYAGGVQVKENIQTQLSVQLHAKDPGKVAWADVTTTPAGAEIVIDGTTTSQFTPSRVQLPSGLHVITLKMKGFQPARRTVQVSEGGTVTVDAALKSNPIK
jgi:hypothetical protein